MMVVFKMRDSLPGARYPPICNVLRQWKTSLIPIYRVYRLYDVGVSLISLWTFFYYCEKRQIVQRGSTCS